MNEKLYAEKISAFISRLIRKAPVTGCTDEQITNLEHQYGVLPAVYKEFLTLMGNKAGDFKAGSWFLYQHLDDVNDETYSLMQENGISPPADMFAFLMHQGYTSLFFIRNEASDPEVFCYTEGEDIISTNMTFSQFLAVEMDNY